MKITEFIKNNIVFLDGAMGTVLQQSGLKTGERPERLNITAANTVTQIHKAYFDAGSNIVVTNTFGANILHYSESELTKIITAAVKNAKDAAAASSNKSPKFTALDIGPTGRLLSPLGDLDFEDAVKIFSKTVSVGAACGVDLIFIETMNDLYETKAALLAAKESCDLPVFVSNAYSESGKLITGATPEATVALLESMGADAIGVNCSLGPNQLKPVIEKYLEVSSVPVFFKPNAGLPEISGGKTVYSLNAKDFANATYNIVKSGVSAVGGCCGTTPEYIKELVLKCRGLSPAKITDKNITAICSYSNYVSFNADPVLIGERINPTGKKRLAAALCDNDISYILGEAINQAEKGAAVLDVNTGLAEIDEAAVLPAVVREIQAVTDLPLQIDTGNAKAMEAALRIYNGKPLINSVNGKKECMDTVFPLQKKYGGVVIALTLDESGIPETVEGRLNIAQKIIERAAFYGISKKDIIFDPLALTVSAESSAAKTTLNTVKAITEKLNCRTSLGVSNVSFGLPGRSSVNAAFLLMALENGLSAAIVNPYSEEITDAFYAYRVLSGLDANCSDYINYKNGKLQTAANNMPENSIDSLADAVIKGLKSRAAQLTEQLILSRNPLDIVNEEIIPALDTVGKRFEEKTVFLPQLLMSAEAASAAFEVIKATVIKSGAKKETKGKVVLATVKGDIHDIGKNIVRLLLENYGFEVLDLGKDVAPEAVVDAVIKSGAKMAGLSALMTTTLPAMEQTVQLLNKKAPFCKTAVGGAVLKKEYAANMGADFYCADAMETVRFALSIYS